MKTIYVYQTVIIKQVVTMVVKDEADLMAQIAERKARFEATKFVAEPERTKEGLKLHQMNKDWPPYP